jgi:hypothetical protein
MMKTYLTVTMRVRDHMMSDSTWMMSFLGGGAENVDENTYRGLIERKHDVGVQNIVK